MTETVEEKLKLLPSDPGVYIMKDHRGRIIYVGKAKVLKNRVRQYFHPAKNHSPKVLAMVEKIADFETIITSSEVEALILECNLIKKHRPRYNISLKDDKTYPYIKVTLGETFPRVFLTRRLVKDGSRYFGPYTDVTAAKESLKLLLRLFPLRTCKRMGDRTCLEYHIKRCPGPCVKKISPEEYRYLTKSVCLFLEGRTAEVERDLTTKMKQAADDLRFEAAAALRDQLNAVKRISEKQKIVTVADEDMDAVGIARIGDRVCVNIFYIRSGKMVGREKFMMSEVLDESKGALTVAFLRDYYARAAFIPSEILLPGKEENPLSNEDKSLLETWLSKEKGSKVELLFPKRGEKQGIVELARENAKKILEDEETRLIAAGAQREKAVLELQKYLSLREPPNIMECFDISHNQGQETVASMVVFENGEAKKSAYRRFKIKSTEGKPDDFKSMREVTQRRYVKDGKNLPDLIIVDGGKGQLSSALEIIRGAGINIPVVGLAKQFELIFVEGKSEPVELPRGSASLYLMERIRDEAHRFAITYHRKLRRKRNMVSALDNIPGIGEKRKKALFAHFGSLEKIKEASIEELAKVPGMNTSVARLIASARRLTRLVPPYDGEGGG